MTENKVSRIYMIVYLLILFFSLLIAYQLIFLPLHEGFKRGGLPGGRRVKRAVASKVRNTGGGIRTGGGGGGSNMDRVLQNHDEIVNLKAVMNTQYRPLIQNSEGKPTNILSRLAALEGDVQALTKNAMDQQDNKVDSVPQAPDFKK